MSVSSNKACKAWLIGSVFVWLMFEASAVFAGDNLGKVASLIVSTFQDLGKLITAGSYIGGVAFAISSILKFKQHKDNAAQITIGQPIGMLAVAIAMLFLPSVMKVAGYTLFSDGGKVASSQGLEFTPGG